MLTINKACDDKRAQTWRTLNTDVTEIYLVAIGSPQASMTELQQIASQMGEHRCLVRIDFIATNGRDVIAASARDGTAEQLAQAGIRIIPDLRWCSITEPLFLPGANVLMTNSRKYAHYADGLCGCKVRFSSLRNRVEAAVNGAAKLHPPQWTQEVLPETKQQMDRLAEQRKRHMLLILFSRGGLCRIQLSARLPSSLSPTWSASAR